MKRKALRTLLIIACVMVLCVTLLACACDPTISTFFESEDFEDVISVELINYDNPKQKRLRFWAYDHSADLKPFDCAQMSCIEVLDESGETDFFDELCKMRVRYDYYVYDSPKGICIRLNYSNGDFIIVQQEYVGRFYSDGSVAEFIGYIDGKDPLKSLVNNYFQSQI
ncbi:MAG: hypothetical protein K2N18_06495 [Clostridia bacterium]|nr:hypothetical protein [Clostridia bacterium]